MGGYGGMVSLLALLSIPLHSQASGITGGVEEYCQDKKFTASCPENQVVLMQSALFGRVKMGQCVKRDLGYTPCKKDVIRLMDTRCSGHQSCEVSIMDRALRSTTPCPEDVSWHLMAGYKCVQLSIGNRMECMTKHHIPLTTSSGYLGSAAGGQLKGSPGTDSCPYRLQGKPGQRFNITLYNFASTASPRREINPDICYDVAKIRDGAEGGEIPVTVCSRQDRMLIGHVSESHIVDIYFPSRSSGIQSLIHYEVLGCRDIKLPEGSTFSKKGTKLTVLCDFTDQKWTLECKNQKWEGTLGNCTETTGGGATAWSVDELFGKDNNFPYGILIVVAVGVALGIFLGGSLLFLASVYIKRKRQRYLQRETPDCVLAQREPHIMRADDALCLEGKPYLDRDYDPCGFHTPEPLRSTHTGQPQGRDSIHKPNIGKEESHVTSPEAVTSFPAQGKGTLGHGVHGQYGSNARSCQHHYESPQFS